MHPLSNAVSFTLELHASIVRLSNTVSFTLELHASIEKLTITTVDQSHNFFLHSRVYLWNNFSAKYFLLGH